MQVQFDVIIQYRAELERLNYIRETINVYLRSIRRLFRLMEEHDVMLGDLTPDVAANLVLQAPWHCDRQQYAVFIVRRFVDYLAAQGMAEPPTPPTPAELARAALRHDWEDYLRRQRGLADKTIVRAAPMRYSARKTHHSGLSLPQQVRQLGDVRGDAGGLRRGPTALTWTMTPPLRGHLGAVRNDGAAGIYCAFGCVVCGAAVPDGVGCLLLFLFHLLLRSRLPTGRSLFGLLSLRI